MDLSAPLLDLIPGARGRVLASLSRFERPVSVLELATVAGVDNRHAGRIVDDLTDAGLVTEFRAGAARMVAMNHDHLLYDPLRELTGTRRRLVGRLRVTLEAESAVAGAWLFGSVARGEGNRASDVDVILVARDSLDSPEWEAFTSRLRDDVTRCTGNRLQLLEHTTASLRSLVKSRKPIISELRCDGIALVARGADLLRAAS